MLSVVLLSILAMVMLPTALRSLYQNEIKGIVVTVAGSLRNAQASAQAGRGDSSWGVKLTGYKVIIFKGTTYLARDAAYDAEAVISTNIAVSGTDEVVFSRIEGLASFPGSPPTPGVITLTLGDQVKTVNINARGGLTY